MKVERDASVPPSGEFRVYPENEEEKVQVETALEAMGDYLNNDWVVIAVPRTFAESVSTVLDAKGIAPLEWAARIRQMDSLLHEAHAEIEAASSDALNDLAATKELADRIGLQIGEGGN